MSGRIQDIAAVPVRLLHKVHPISFPGRLGKGLFAGKSALIEKPVLDAIAWSRSRFIILPNSLFSNVDR